MKTIAKIFIGALIATGGIAFYMSWKKKQAANSTTTPAPVGNGGQSSGAPVTSTPATTTATSTSAPVKVDSTGFAPAATNPAASTTTTVAQTSTTVPNAVSVQSAKDRFNGLISGGGISNVFINPGYGIGYTQSGVARAARIPEIEAYDKDYINTFQSLINAAGIAKV